MERLKKETDFCTADPAVLYRDHFPAGDDSSPGSSDRGTVCH